MLRQNKKVPIKALLSKSQLNVIMNYQDDFVIH